MHLPLVSIIIPTRNSAQFLGACLTSIINQTYKNIEMIVVDNNSTDKTKEIAKKYTKNIFNIGPERSAQRNLGAKSAKGEYFLFIDSDMELTPKVIEECVKSIQSEKGTSALVIPEKSIGIGFWAKCKALEKSFYIGITWIEAARFFLKDSYLEVGGYDESLVSGEDWDISQKIKKMGKIGRISEFILHNEGHLTLRKILIKKYYYSQKFSNYLNKHRFTKRTNPQINILFRYNLFFSQPKKLFKNPLRGLGMLIMKTCEFCFGGAGYVIEKLKKYEK